MRAPRLLPAALLAVLLGLLALTGCGDDQVKENNRYVAQTDRVVQAFETRFQALQADFTPSSTATQDLATLTKLEGAVTKVTADLGRIDPPGGIAALHARLVKETGEYRAVIATARTGFSSQDLQVIATARTRFSRGLAAVAAKITNTINTINAKLE